MTIETDAKNFGRIFLGRELAVVDEYHAALIRAAQEGVRILRSVLPIDQGDLRKETHLEMEGASPVIVEDQPYAAAQEVGTRPFTPPLDPLIAWARRQAPNIGLDAQDDDEIEQFARAVQAKIAAVGITAKWSTRDAMPKLEAVLMAELSKLRRAG